MAARTDIERALDTFMAEGPETVSDRAILQSLTAIDRTPQRRSLAARGRFLSMTPYARAVAALVAVVALGGAIYLFAPSPGGFGGPPVSPTASPTPPPSPTASPVGTLAQGATDGWTAFTSAQYGFTISHPSGWTATPAARAWSFAADAQTWLSPAEDSFIAFDQQVRVAAWAVPLTDPQMNQSWADLERWVVDYCQQTKNTGCTTIHDRAVPLCVEARDCHPAPLVPFAEDVQAFGYGGVLPPGMMVVVTVARGESDPHVEPYGGATRLLEDFLSTMGIVPPAFPESKSAAATFLTTGH
jgi:hypothetical protein